MSLSGLTKEIHQIWIVVRILRELTSELLMLPFEQSSYSPIAVIGDYAVWYEFDLNPYTMFKGIAWRERVPQELREIYERAEEVERRLKLNSLPLRPDIAFTYAKNAEEFMRRPTVKLIIECKNSNHSLWKKDVESQIRPYMEIFQPEYMVIASLKPVPQYLKKVLLSHGIEVIDNVHPEGLGEQELLTYVKQVLGIEAQNP
jgi:hypothetical protein